MELKYKLLDHPFYKAWEDGAVTLEQLSGYHSSYSEFIRLIPKYWSKILNGLNVNTETGKSVIKEEAGHTALWDLWKKGLPANDAFPRMDNIIDEFNNMTPSELLGAIHAFEIQQPDVACSKKEGLVKHYGFSDESTIYFDEHMKEQEHIDYGKYLYENFADKQEFKNGFIRGSELIYKGLDIFIN